MRLLLLSFVVWCTWASAAAPATRPAADIGCDQLLAKWTPAFTNEHFTSCTAEPFVIAGDLPRRELLMWSQQTIRPAVAALQRAYFKKKPDRPVLILLFASDQSYRRYAKLWFNDTDVSHFGYFRAGAGVMLMNISTGGGTLVHELVHALLRPDFPECPDWVNEGMGSLYEQCTLTPLAGLVNWRLPALQEAIAKDELRSLTDLIQDPDFYADGHVGMNYAQARYLMLYLQEKGQLQRFYAELRDTDDRSGLKTLLHIIAPGKLADFERQWREWVSKLRYADQG